MNQSEQEVNYRCYAIVPAAGRSRRMGTPKLLLPFRDSVLMDCVLDAWLASRIDAVIVVVRRGDTALRQLCEK